MSIISISRGSYSRGKEVAEKVAARLGYECISRDVLIEASEQFNIPEIKLVKAIHDAPSFLDRFTYGKEKYIAYIRAALLKHVQRDNVVYHGQAGHFFLQGVSHALKVLIIAEMNDRISEVMKRNNVSAEEAEKMIKKIDEERQKWAHHLYRADARDANLYDQVLHINKLSVDDAVDIICHTVSLPQFKTTPESQKNLDEFVLAAQVKAALVDHFPKTIVSVKEGAVTVSIEAQATEQERIREQIDEIANGVEGVKEVNIYWSHTTPYDHFEPPYY